MRLAAMTPPVAGRHLRRKHPRSIAFPAWMRSNFQQLYKSRLMCSGGGFYHVHSYSARGGERRRQLMSFAGVMAMKYSRFHLITTAQPSRPRHADISYRSGA
ncbi:hypothetical protein KCP75_04270 [Salmonella enterica subsp. enterica]|nr:hypothetical protein KCP75_04270 [Salmonella enterica subsp. enterica]